MSASDVKSLPSLSRGSVTRYSSISELDLVCACASQNDEAWGEFVSRFRRPISVSIIRATYQWGQVPGQVLDDLIQDTYLKLCADKCERLLVFAVQHPEAIQGYIKTIAVNVARDYFKASHSQKRGSGNPGQTLDDVQPSTPQDRPGAQGAMEREILMNQIGRCLDVCSAGPDQERDQMIFWLYYEQGVTAKAIAALPSINLTSKGVESAISRLTRLVREQVVQLRTEKNVEADRGEKGFRPATSF